MATITFSGVVKDYDSHWYFGFYRVKPDAKISNPNAASGTSSMLVYLINKSVESKISIGCYKDLVGRRITVSGFWFTRPLADRHYFEIETVTVEGGVPDQDSARDYEISAAEHESPNIDY